MEFLLTTVFRSHCKVCGYSEWGILLLLGHEFDVIDNGTVLAKKHLPRCQWGQNNILPFSQLSAATTAVADLWPVPFTAGLWGIVMCPPLGSWNMGKRPIAHHPLKSLEMLRKNCGYFQFKFKSIERGTVNQHQSSCGCTKPLDNSQGQYRIHLNCAFRGQAQLSSSQPLSTECEWLQRLLHRECVTRE